MRLGQLLPGRGNILWVAVLNVGRYDGLAYCTWNALGRELSEDRILSALQDLSDNGINGWNFLWNLCKFLSNHPLIVSTLIIDDNWQSLVTAPHRSYRKGKANPRTYVKDDNRRWDKFEANANFPKGLGHTTSEIRRRFKNIKHIAVWHALVSS